jgi:hypothetical protein
MLMATSFQLPRDGYGDAIFTKHWNEDCTQSWITCDHADPRIRISDVVIDQILRGEIPEGSLVLPGDARTVMTLPAARRDLIGAVLKINCANRVLIYRITGWEPVWLEDSDECGSYLAEWPD